MAWREGCHVGHAQIPGALQNKINEDAKRRPQNLLRLLSIRAEIILKIRRLIK
jgi:hypothetical protein